MAFFFTLGEVWSPASPACYSSCDEELTAFHYTDYIPLHKKTYAMYFKQVQRLGMRISESQADVKTQGDEGRNELRLLFVLLSYHNSLTVFMGVFVSSHLACRSSCRLPECHQLPVIHYVPPSGLSLYCKMRIYEVNIVQILKQVTVCPQ